MTRHQQMTTGWPKSAGHSIILAAVGILLAAEPFFAQNANNGSLKFSVDATATTERRAETQIENLRPYTHFALIPSAYNPKTIRLEKVKVTKVFTQAKITTDSSYCRDLQFRDPGGSMYCSHMQDVSPTVAYKVIYSYQGKPLASDEYGNRNFTFAVYFRPDELPLALRREISNGKVDRAELATYFKVSTDQRPIEATAIDHANSSFCQGNYDMDANWSQDDQRCRDKVSFQTALVSPSYAAVQVEPVSPRSQEAVASR